MTPVLLDTGVIVALLDRRESFHARCAAAVQVLERPLITCEAVIAESCYLLRDLAGAAEAVVENVERGVFQIRFHLPPAAARVRALLGKYRTLPADFADACLVDLADQLGAGDILTLDRDFQTYRWRRTRPFRLLIPLDH
ncbi:MAG: type II toxin-antitoxin system VapC family toxin [Terriglobales bacterium]